MTEVQGILIQDKDVGQRTKTVKIGRIPDRKCNVF